MLQNQICATDGNAIAVVKQHPSLNGLIVVKRAIAAIKIPKAAVTTFENL
jgi:hypothetical protein